MSTTTRILLAFLVLLGAAMWFLLSKIEQRVRRQYLEAVEGPMVDVANMLAALLEPRVHEDGSIDLAEFRATMAQGYARQFKAQIYDVLKTSVNMQVYVTDRRGLVLFDSRGLAEGQNYLDRRDVALTLLGTYGARSTARDPKDRTSSIMYVAAPIYHEGKIAGVVSVAKAHRDVLDFIIQTRGRIRLIGWSLFGAVALGAIVATTFFSRPIQRLTRYARSVARGERVAAPRFGSPELATLAHALEEMRDALEDRKYVASYVQTLTHEMKSPVAAIRGATELLHESGVPPDRRERFLANIEAESNRLQKIIDRLLVLAEIESRKVLKAPEPVSPGDLARNVCAHLRPAAESRQVKIEFADEGALTVTGERFLLEIALTNLIQNAIEFSPGGGVIHVRSKPEDSGKAALFIVEDEGPGIPDYALPHIFDRFYSLQRPATGRKSSGLGLCFVREAAELHSGNIMLANREDRSGVRAILRLPIA